MDIKGSRDREKTHPSDGSFLGYHLGCVLMMEGGEEGLRENQVYFHCMPNLLVIIFVSWETATMYQKKIKSVKLYLNLTLNLPLTIIVSEPYLCHVFDSCDLLNSSLRSIYKVERTRICKYFSSHSHGPFPLPVSFPLVQCSLPQDSALNIIGT